MLGWHLTLKCFKCTLQNIKTWHWRQRKLIWAQNCTCKARFWLAPFEPIGAKDLSLTFGSMQVKRFPSRFRSFCRQIITVVMILRYFSHSLVRKQLSISLSSLFIFSDQFKNGESNSNKIYFTISRLSLPIAKTNLRMFIL